MLIARFAHSCHLQVAGKQIQGWYVQIFDTEQLTPRYSEEEQQRIASEAGGTMSLYSGPLCQVQKGTVGKKQ